MDIHSVNEGNLEYYFKLAAPLINEAIDHQELVLEDIEKRLKEGTMGLIVVTDYYIKDGILAGCLIELTKYARSTALRVVALGGTRMDDWLGDLLEFLDKYAIENHFIRIEQAGRKGWTKVLAKYGYKQKYVVMTKELDNV